MCEYEHRCYFECPGDELYIEGRCAPPCPEDKKYDPETQTCKYKCPPGQIYNPSTQTCQPYCPEDETYNPATQTCELKCPEDKVYNPLTKKCEPKCPPDKPYDPKTGSCRPTCPEDQQYNPNTETCEPKCPEDKTYNPATQACDPKCPEDQKYNLTTQTCEPKCSPDKTYNTATGNCDPKCPPDKVYDPGTGTCKPLYPPEPPPPVFPPDGNGPGSNCRQQNGGGVGGIPAGVPGGGGTPAPLSGAPEVGDPILVGTGNVYLQETDLSLPNGLSLIRTYNAANTSRTHPSALGRRWQHNFDRTLVFGSADGVSHIDAVRADGKIHRFLIGASGIAPATPATLETLTVTADGYRLQGADDAIETYDGNGKLLSIATRDGNLLTLTHAAGQLTRIADPFDRALDLTYTAGQLTRVTAPGGASVAYTYDAAGNLAQATLPDNTARQYHYADPRFPTALTGLTDQTGALAATWAYNDQGHATANALAGGLAPVSLAFDAAYTGDGSVTVTDALGTSRTYTFQKIHGRTRNTGVSQPGGAGCGPAARSVSYDANGNPASRTDFDGVTTTYAYDPARNLLLSRTEAAGTAQARTTSTQWHAVWRLPVQTSEPGKTTRYRYHGDAGVSCAPAGALIAGRPLPLLCQKTEQASGSPERTWAWTYNARGKPLTQDGPRTDVSDLTAYTYYYDDDPDPGKRGQPATVTDPLGHVTTYAAFDAAGRPTRVLDANGRATQYAYDPLGRLTQASVGNETTTYTYDGAGRLTRIAQPDGSFLAYTLDGAGRTTALSDAAGNRIDYTLDAAGNVTEERISDPGGALARSIRRTYDALGRVESVSGLPFQRPLRP